MSNLDILIKGALLHDIGKLCLRAKCNAGNHSQAGAQLFYNFLENYSFNYINYFKVQKRLRVFADLELAI